MKTERGDSIMVVQPLFPEERGGSIPTSPLHKCPQRTIREGVGARPMRIMQRRLYEEICPLGGYSFGRISRHDARAFISKYEWLGHPGRALIFYGAWKGDQLYGVEGFCTPPYFVWKNLDESVRDLTLYLARGACCLDAGPHAASMLISASLRDLRKRGYKIVIAYSDASAGEEGIVYRAANAAYGGIAARKTLFAKVAGRWVSENGLMRSFGTCDLKKISGSVEEVKYEIVPKKRFYWLLDPLAPIPDSWRE